MSDNKRTWDPGMHDWSELGETGEESQQPEAHQICSKGGVHTDKELARSPFCLDGDPAWIKYQCTKCGRIDVVS